jgi:hypothetical protein
MANWLRKFFGGSSNPATVATDASGGGVYSNLRHQALTVRRADVGIPAPPPESPAWCVVMETGYPGANATLVAFGDGTTSLYFSNGGGVIGGHAHENVRRAGAAFVEAANRARQGMKPCESFPAPSECRVLFYTRTDSEALTCEAGETELGDGRHPLSPLFYAGQEVLTQLRLISQDAEAEGER